MPLMTGLYFGKLSQNAEISNFGLPMSEKVP